MSPVVKGTALYLFFLPPVKGHIITFTLSCLLSLKGQIITFTLSCLPPLKGQLITFSLSCLPPLDVSLPSHFLPLKGQIITFTFHTILLKEQTINFTSSTLPPLNGQDIINFTLPTVSAVVKGTDHYIPTFMSPVVKGTSPYLSFLPPLKGQSLPSHFPV